MTTVTNIMDYKKILNTPSILNELQNCLVKNDNEWAVWFRGYYLGTIKKENAVYSLYSSNDNYCGYRTSFMKSLSIYIDAAIVIMYHNKNIKIKNNFKEPEIRTWGLREPKSLLQKIKGFFK